MKQEKILVYNLGTKKICMSYFFFPEDRVHQYYYTYKLYNNLFTQGITTNY